MWLITYLREVRAELVHISWPTPRQAVVYTILIIVISVVAALYLGALDFLFEAALKFII
jgi:preprotein translocase SecE subunit